MTETFKLPEEKKVPLDSTNSDFDTNPLINEIVALFERAGEGGNMEMVERILKQLEQDRVIDENEVPAKQREIEGGVDSILIEGE